MQPAFAAFAVYGPTETILLVYGMSSLRDRSVFSPRSADRGQTASSDDTNPPRLGLRGIRKRFWLQERDEDVVSRNYDLARPRALLVRAKLLLTRVSTRPKDRLMLLTRKFSRMSPYEASK